MDKARPRVVRSPAAVGDIVEVADYIAQMTSLAAADRFIAATDKTFEQLAAMPGMGTRYEPDDPACTRCGTSPFRDSATISSFIARCRKASRSSETSMGHGILPPSSMTRSESPLDIV